MSPNRDDLGAIDVAALMAQVRLQVPRDTVTVQGTVAELRTWSKDPTITFGELRGFDGSTMSFKCPVSAGLSREDHAVLRGTLYSYKSKKHRGFDLLLEGTRVGAWTPNEPPAVQRPLLERTEPKRTLQRYLSGKSIQSLALIGTEVGIRDTKQACLEPTTLAATGGGNRNWSLRSLD